MKRPPMVKIRPEDREAEIVYKQKLWNGQEYQVDERKFAVVSVESYVVSEFPIGQKLLITENRHIASNQRFIPEE